MFKTLLVAAVLGMLTMLPSQVNAQFCKECQDMGGYFMCMDVTYGYNNCHMDGFGRCQVWGGSCGTPPGGGCFLSGTPVDTPEGKRPIETLQTGDMVLSGTDADGTPQFSTISTTYKNLASEYYILNGRISVTGTHPFRVGMKWKEVKDLRVGDKLQGIEGEAIPVVSIEKVERGVRIYNIEVDKAHTFFAGDLLVHNKPPDPQG